jgi:hypothetical protein
MPPVFGPTSPSSRAFQEFLDNDSRARFAETSAGEHVGCRCFGFFERHRDDHAFTSSKAVSLDDDRRTLLANIGERRFQVGKVLVGGRRNVVACEEILRKGLRTFKLSGRRGRAKARQVKFVEAIDHAGDQRCLRTNDRQGHFLRACQRCERLDIVGRYIDVTHLVFARRAGIAGRHEHFVYTW